MEPLATWPPQDATLSQDDFQQFLDMDMAGLDDEMQFEFQDFTALPLQQQQQQQPPPTTAIQPLSQPPLHHAAELRKPGGRIAATSVGILSGLRPTMMESSGTRTSHATMPESDIVTAAGTGNNSIHASPALGPQVASSANANIAELDAQIQYLQQQRKQQQQRREMEQQQNFYAHHRYIPPTPNSVEMTGGASVYSSSAPGQAGLMDRYRMPRDQEIAFTPLASPAVTPLETQFAIPEYAVPGAYFSPLSSPALHAQTEQSTTFMQRHAKSTTSPIDSTYDTHSAPGSAIILPRKSNKRASTKQRSANRSMRQSPIVKPMKRRSLSTTLPGYTLDSIRGTSILQQSGNIEGTSTETSEEGSISPEHLSDMAPPPIPAAGVMSQSPGILAQKSQMNAKRLSLGSPATPASLMKLTQSPAAIQPQSGQDMDLDSPITALQLPAAVHAPDAGGQLDQRQSSHPRQSSTTSSQATPKQVPTTPSSSTPVLAPQNGSSGRPLSNLQPASTGSSERSASGSTPSRPSKKRSLASNAPAALVSPAILPRISPSIKPLLPSTVLSRGITVSQDTASLLLASKSNYQNIIEGNHLPGVNYPSELSTNLTSKRTSHKIAEQGRRNRINHALQEMGKLLPKSMGGEASDGSDAQVSKEMTGHEGHQNESGPPATNAEPGAVESEKAKDNDKDKSSSAASANSKASTVECAIEYIKHLQRELQEARQRADAAEQELQVVKGGVRA